MEDLTLAHTIEKHKRIYNEDHSRIIKNNRNALDLKKEEKKAFQPHEGVE